MSDQRPIPARKSRTSRREEILEALASELESRPGVRITTARLAEVVGVSEAALYRHFPSKARMFEALMDFAEESVFGLLSRVQAEGGDLERRVERSLVVLLRFSERNPGITRVLLGEALLGEHERLRSRSAQFFERFETQLRQILREEALLTGPRMVFPASTIASVLAAVVEGRMARSSRGGFRRSRWKTGITRGRPWTACCAALLREREKVKLPAQMRSRSAASTVTSTEVVLDSGEVVTFDFHRVARRKHAHLYVTDAGQIQLRAPWRFSLVEARRQIAASMAWIRERQAHAAWRMRQRPRLTDGTCLPFLDEQLKLRVETSAQLDLPLSRLEARRNQASAWVLRRGNELLARTLTPDGDELRQLLLGWYREEARAVLTGRLEPWADRLGLRPARVRIANQRSCWGSCSSHSTISLNWRLVLLPGRLADYVLVHELCHLAHLDHSASFWALVESVLPDYLARRKALSLAQDDLPL